MSLETTADPSTAEALSALSAPQGASGRPSVAWRPGPPVRHDVQELSAVASPAQSEPTTRFVRYRATWLDLVIGNLLRPMRIDGRVVPKLMRELRAVLDEAFEDALAQVNDIGQPHLDAARRRWYDSP